MPDTARAARTTPPLSGSAADMRGMHRLYDQGRDDGFSLIEVLTALAVVGVVLGALGVFSVSGLRQAAEQGRQQLAVQMALDGVEKARALSGATILTGRGECTTCPAAPDAKVAAYLTGTRRYDGTVPGVTPLLPRTEQLPLTGGLTGTRYFYVGRCYRAANGTCGTIVGPESFYRVVVAVTWPGPQCGGTCSHVTSALFTANNTDPLFQNS